MNYQETVNFNGGEEKPLRMAGFGPRWGALLVDINILAIIMVFLSTLLTSIIGFTAQSMFRDILFSNMLQYGRQEDYFGFIIMMYLAALFLIKPLYYAFFEWSRFQGTPGKIAVKIKVVDRSGQGVSFLQAFGRNLTKLLSNLILNIGFLMPLFTDKKQALHDMIASTYVVMKD